MKYWIVGIAIYITFLTYLDNPKPFIITPIAIVIGFFIVFGRSE